MNDKSEISSESLYSFKNTVVILFSQVEKQEEAMRAEEERKQKEEQERIEHEEYLKMKEMFSVDEEGEADTDANLDVSFFSYFIFKKLLNSLGV